MLFNLGFVCLISRDAIASDCTSTSQISYIEPLSVVIKIIRLPVSRAVNNFFSG